MIILNEDSKKKVKFDPTKNAYLKIAFRASNLRCKHLINVTNDVIVAPIITV